MSINKFFPLLFNKSSGADLPGVNTSTGNNNVGPGFQPVLFFGDSNMAGRGEVPGPTPVPGTVYQWNGSSIVAVTNNDLINAVVGSIGPKLGIEWYNRTGFKLVIIPRGSGGSNFYPDGDTNNWFLPGGTLWNPCVTSVNNCLNYLGVTELRFAFRKLGINDARADQVALSNVLLGITDGQTRFRAAFGSRVPLLTCNVGQEENGITSRVLSVRQMIEDEAVNYARTYVAVRDENYLQYYKSDKLHLGQTGLNLQAVELCNFILANNL
jgi:hypothetical protein